MRVFHIRFESYFIFRRSLSLLRKIGLLLSEDTEGIRDTVHDIPRQHTLLTQLVSSSVTGKTVDIHGCAACIEAAIALSHG